MLPKPQRLTRGFEIVFRKGAKISTPFFVLRAIPAWDEVPRLAITVSKKVDKRAVGRNRIRRRLIEAAKKAGFPESPNVPCRIVCIGFGPTKDAPFEEIVNAFQYGFSKLENWKFPPKPKKK